MITVIEVENLQSKTFTLANIQQCTQTTRYTGSCVMILKHSWIYDSAHQNKKKRFNRTCSRKFVVFPILFFLQTDFYFKNGFTNYIGISIITQKSISKQIKNLYHREIYWTNQNNGFTIISLYQM